MTADEMRRIIREEMLGKGISIEFAELTKIEGGDSFLPREDWTPDDIYSADDELEKLTRGEPLSLTKHAGTADLGWDQEVSVPLAKSEKRHADGVEIVSKIGYILCHAFAITVIPRLEERRLRQAEVVLWACNISHLEVVLHARCTPGPSIASARQR